MYDNDEILLEMEFNKANKIIKAIIAKNKEEKEDGKMENCA